MNNFEDNSNNNDLTESPAQPNMQDEIQFFPVSEGKLITLYILSFGLYGVYWFYKNWQLQAPSINKKIYPAWRAIFSIFFTHALFNRINDKAVTLEMQHKFNANVLATIFVVAIVVSNILDYSSGGGDVMQGITSNSFIITSFVLFLLSTYPLVKVQATVNRINNDMLGYLNHHYSLWNYVLIIVGAITWFLIITSVLFKSMGLVIAEQ